MNLAYVSVRNLSRKATRTTILFAIVLVVSCTLFAATLFLRSVDNALRIGTYRLGADILVVPESAETKAKAALLSGEPTQFLMNASVLDQVRGIDGVKVATPQLFLKPTSFTCCFDVDVFLVAYDPATDFTVRPWAEKHLARKLAQNEVITGREIPVVVGDNVPFFGTFFQVAGTMEPTGMDFFDRAAFMSLDAAYKMAADSGTQAVQRIDLEKGALSTVLVQVDPSIDPSRVAMRIEHDVPGVKALVSDKVISTVRTQLSGLIQAIVAISAVLWVIVLLIMAFAFFMIVNERRREIGLLRAMGASRRHVAGILLTEASLLSAGGGAAGVALGFGLLLSFRALILRQLKLPYLFPQPRELVALTVAALAFAIVTGILSALLPSVSVVRTEPYDAIRSSE
jgi:putative ABC transport system permease protein